MTDRPILFSAPMIHALLEGRKTQTRRLAWRKCCDHMGWVNGRCFGCGERKRPTLWQKVKPEDRLWVRETFNHAPGDGIAYRATEPQMNGAPWTPSIHMPRWASRLTLCVTDVRREELRDISEGDAIAEGMGIFPHSMSAGKRFREIWASINGPDAWASNPEVVALTFTVHKANIDQLGEQAA